MHAIFCCFLALFFQTFLDDFLVWFRFSRCEWFLKDVLGSMVFTVFSAHSHFVQTLFFQSFPFKFASKFRLFFVLVFEEKLRKLAKKSVMSLISQLEALFSIFWLTFSDFWSILADFGGPGAACGEHFWRFLGFKNQSKI